MQTLVLFPAEQALGQEPVDVCAVPFRPPSTEIIESLRGLRVKGALFEVPTQPLLLRGQFPSPITTEEPYPRQDPIYLTPSQAAAEIAFLSTQQGEAVLPAFLRRLFTPQA